MGAIAGGVVGGLLLVAAAIGVGVMLGNGRLKTCKSCCSRSKRLGGGGGEGCANATGLGETIGNPRASAAKNYLEAGAPPAGSGTPAFEHPGGGLTGGGVQFPAVATQAVNYPEVGPAAVQYPEVASDPPPPPPPYEGPVGIQHPGVTK